MITRSVKIKLYVPQCHSLKEKRMILQRIVTRVKNKFNVSIAEVDLQDVHQTICLGVAVVSGGVLMLKMFWTKFCGLLKILLMGI